eukprot:5731448-Lingulodinium_polyedra.AAC.1
MEWRALRATPCQRVQGLVPHICMDLGMSEPCAKADVDKLYRNDMLEDPVSKSKGGCASCAI